jgi:hypothetical protein
MCCVMTATTGFSLSQFTASLACLRDTYIQMHSPNTTYCVNLPHDRRLTAVLETAH